MVTTNCELVLGDKKAGTKTRCLCGKEMPNIKTTPQTWWEYFHIQKGQ